MAGSFIPAGLDATLLLVRHGESEWITKGLFQGQGDSPLTLRGRRQAALAANRIANARRPPALPVPEGPPVTIVHSPLARAAATAEAIAGALSAGQPAGAGTDVSLRADPGFLEIGQGEWEGLPGTVIAERWPEVLDGWRNDPPTAWAPGGESLPEVDARVRTALGRVLGELAAARPATDAARSRVLGYADLPSQDPWAVIVAHDGVFKVTALALLGLPLARFWMLPWALCGISVIEIQDGEVRLRVHNVTDHLAELETEAAAAREAARAETGAL